MEDWQGAIDDATRLLEYCEVFDDRMPDLEFKALTR
jgi:hypothetical protein